MDYTFAFSGYSVGGIEEAKKFYGETLGLRLEESKEGLQIKLTGGTTTFLYPKADHVPATFTVLNFEVADIDAAVASLKERGVIIENYDSGPMVADEHGIYRGRLAGYGPDIAWFKDPAGNILSVLQN